MVDLAKITQAAQASTQGSLQLAQIVTNAIARQQQLAQNDRQIALQQRQVQVQEQKAAEESLRTQLTMQFQGLNSQITGLLGAPDNHERYARALDIVNKLPPSQLRTAMQEGLSRRQQDGLSIGETLSVRKELLDVGGEFTADLRKENLAQANKLGEEFRKSDEFKSYRTIDRQVANVVFALENPSGLSDVVAAIGFMKTLEPTSAVMPTEARNLAQSGGFQGTWDGLLLYLNSEKGQSGLPAYVRLALVDQLEASHAAARQQLEQQINIFDDLAVQSGVNPDQVVSRIDEISILSPGRIKSVQESLTKQAGSERSQGAQLGKTAGSAIQEAARGAVTIGSAANDIARGIGTGIAAAQVAIQDALTTPPPPVTVDELRRGKVETPAATGRINR